MASIWPITYSTWRPSLRTSSASPQQTIGVRPASSAFLALAPMSSFVSPWYSRRSEWPTTA